MASSELAGLFLERADELLADDLALRLRVRDVGELVQETALRVHVDERHVGVLGERLDDLLGLVVPEKAVVDEDARQIVADGPVDEHRRRRRVDPAGEPADGPRVSDLVPYPLDRVGDDVDRRPLGLAAAGLVEEVLEDLHPVLRVPDLGMELDPERPCSLSSNAMIGTEGVSAVTSKPSGTEKTASPWLVQAFCSSGVPAKRPSWLLTTRSERPYSRIWTAPTSPPSTSAMSCIP